MRNLTTMVAGVLALLLNLPLPATLTVVGVGAAVATSATATSCGGSSTQSLDREETPPVTPGTVYVQTVGNYNPNLPDRPLDNSGKYSNVLRPTWTFDDGTVLTNMVKDQGHLFVVTVKNGVGELKVADHTDAPIYIQKDDQWGFKQVDREKASGRPVPIYVHELGTFQDAVEINHNGANESVGATFKWIPGIPFSTLVKPVPIPLRNGVSATPEGMADIGRRYNGWEYMSAVIRETITIRERTGESWLTAFVTAVGVVGASSLMMAAPALCPDEQNLSQVIFVDGGGNDNVVPTPVTKLPPVAMLTITPASAVATVNRTLSAAGSNDPDGGSITKYEWDFDGNGTYDQTTTTVTAAHIYPATQTAKVRVTDDEGVTATATATASVVAAHLPLDLRPEDRTIVKTFTIVYSAVNCDGIPSWTVTGGTITPGANGPDGFPTATYVGTTVGTFTVTVTCDGESDSTTVTVTAPVDPPANQFDGYVAEIRPYDAVSLTVAKGYYKDYNLMVGNTTTGEEFPLPGVTYKWTWDGGPGEQASALEITGGGKNIRVYADFATLGAHTLKGVATSPNGLNTLTNTVTITVTN